MSEHIEQIRALMAKNEWMQKDIATKIGMSEATVNRYLSGSYNGNVANVDKKMLNLLQFEAEKTAENTSAPFSKFVMTKTVGHMMYAARQAHLNNDICVIHGDPGMGKTWFLKQYHQQFDNTVLIEVDPDYTVRDLLESLGNRLDVATAGRLHKITSECMAELNGSDWAILVDEAEHLPFKALELLRRIHDKTGVALVLCGTKTLKKNLMGRHGEYKQLFSRVGFVLDIGTQLPEDDISLMVREIMPFCQDEAVIKTFIKESDFNARRLDKLIKWSNRTCIAKKIEMSVAVVKEQSGRLIRPSRRVDTESSVQK